MASRILTVSELAQHLNVHRITIYRLLKSGSLPGFKIGRVWRFDLDEITAWMATGKSRAMLIAENGLVDGKLNHDGHAADGEAKASRTRKPAKISTRAAAKEPAGRKNHRA